MFVAVYISGNVYMNWKLEGGGIVERLIGEGQAVGPTPKKPGIQDQDEGKQVPGAWLQSGRRMGEDDGCRWWREGRGRSMRCYDSNLPHSLSLLTS